MKTNQIIENAVTQLIDMFRTGKLPEAVAFSVIRRHPNDVVPSDKWSLGNRILQLLQGTTDARGYKQWNQVGRHVKKGAHAIYILAPITQTIIEKDERTGENQCRQILKGYRPISVFRVEDTEGKALFSAQAYSPTTKPTFFDVAEKLNIAVHYRPMKANYLGRYQINTNTIELCSEDAIVYYHELSHAIHETFVDLRVYDKDKSEIVAEFSAMVLANIAGISGYETQGYAYIENYAAEHKPAGILKEIFSVLNDVEKIVKTVLDVSEDFSIKEIAV